MDITSFKAKFQSNIIFTDWTFRLSTNLNFSKKITQLESKSLKLSKGISINISHEEKEYLISGWSIKSHTFIIAWREFSPSLEDVVALTGLPIFGEAKTIKLPKIHEEVALDEAGKRRLEIVKLKVF